MSGKHILITGAAQGLGAAYARHLASHGARIAVADIQPSKASAIVSEIESSGGEALFVNMDVTQEASVTAGFAKACAHFGPIDVLINNAGGQFGFALAEDVTPEDWNKTIALCLTGSWLCARAVIPAMKNAGRGRIINVVSSTVDRGLPLQMVPYIAAKGGVATLTRGLARELGPHGITVNAISPGLFVMDKGPEIQSLSEMITRDQSIPLAGVPADIVGAVAFLASDASGFITGQVLNVDGGWAFK